MAPSLVSLSNELFEQVVSCLDLDSICTLRLVCRQAAAKAVQSTFQSHLRARRVQLTRHGLETFNKAVSCGLGEYVEDLTLTAILYDWKELHDLVYLGTKRVLKDWVMRNESVQLSKEELAQSTKAMIWLQEQHEDWQSFHGGNHDETLLATAFAHIKRARPRGLKHLSLQFVVISDANQDWRATQEFRVEMRWPVLRAAAETFSLCMSCLDRSKLPLASLDIFSARPASFLSSVPCDLIGQVTPSQMASLSQLRTLAVTISEPFSLHPSHSDDYIYNPEDYDDNEQHVAKIDTILSQGENIIGLPHFLSLCPILESLDLTNYDLPHGNGDDELRSLSALFMTRQMQHFAQRVHLPHLKQFRLGGFVLNAADLIQSLGNHHVSLRSVYLTSLTFKPGGRLSDISNCLIHDRFRLESITFENIWEEGNGRCLFTLSSDRACTTLEGDILGKHVLHCWGEDVKVCPAYYYDDALNHILDDDYIDASRQRLLEYGSWH